VKAQRLGVIADDLTGALDTGVQFSKRGLASLVGLKDSAPSDVACMILNTDSRAVSADVAAARASCAARLLHGRLVYKKIDSTLRGNLGPEIAAVMQALGLERAVVAPAFPANGRTTRNGNLFVQGVLLEHTGFARDPRNAISESHIPSLLARQAGEPVGLVDIATVAQGPEAIRAAIAESASRLVVVDAESQRHLAHIAQAIVQAGLKWLPVGSAGLAEELPVALGLATAAPASAPVSTDISPEYRGPVLVAAGSRNQITADQVSEAAAVLGLPIVEPDMERLVDRAAAQGEIDRLADEAARHLDRFGRCIVTTCFTALMEHRSADIAVCLGRLTRQILERRPVRGLFLTGGDIALQACLALGAEALRPIAEALPGLPVSLLVGGPWANMPVVTKAGGFGAKDAIWICVQYLEEKMTRSEHER